MMQFNCSRWTTPFVAFLSLAACSSAGELPVTVPNDSTEACPAKELQYLVGRDRSVLFTMRFGSEIRFEEPGQMHTQEFKATRTRIIIGSVGKIVRVLCG